MSDGQESPNLQQLPQLIAKADFQIIIKYEQFKKISDWT